MVARRKVGRKTTRQSSARKMRRAPKRTVSRRRTARKTARKIKRPRVRRPKLSGVRVSRRAARKVAARKAAREKVYVGKISHYFTRIGVGVVDIERPMRHGDTVKIEGFTTNFRQKAKSMQLNNKPIKLAQRGKSIGLKVNDRVRQNDKVYIYR